MPGSTARTSPTPDSSHALLNRTDFRESQARWRELEGTNLALARNLTQAQSRVSQGDGFTLFRSSSSLRCFGLRQGTASRNWMMTARLTCRTLRPAAAEAPCPGWWGAERGAGDVETQVEAAARFRMWRAFRTISCSISCSICCF